MNKYIIQNKNIPRSLIFQKQDEILKGDGFLVQSYDELYKYIAQLACANPNVILFFRGQGKDYKAGAPGKEYSTLLPTIYRGDLAPKEKAYKIKQLENAGKILTEKLKDRKIQNAGVISRKRLLKWSLLQHYEVVDTPLIDITQSLRVACSFGLLNNSTGYVYIYVLAIPYYTNRISVNSEEYMTNIRLLSILPSEALRPHHQEGFLIGEDEYPDDLFAHKEEKDLSRRLLYKFKISVADLESSEEKWLDEERLMPNNDPMRDICNEVKQEVLALPIDDGNNALNKTAGVFLMNWQSIEQVINDNLPVRDNSGRYNLFAAINRIDDQVLRNELHQMRIKRNRLVHNGLNSEVIDDSWVKRIENAYRRLKTFLLST